jgi:hypothetical protein
MRLLTSCTCSMVICQCFLITSLPIRDRVCVAHSLVTLQLFHQPRKLIACCHAVNMRNKKLSAYLLEIECSWRNLWAPCSCLSGHAKSLHAGSARHTQGSRGCTLRCQLSTVHSIQHLMQFIPITFDVQAGLVNPKQSEPPF